MALRRVITSHVAPPRGRAVKEIYLGDTLDALVWPAILSREQRTSHVRFPHVLALWAAR